MDNKMQQSPPQDIAKVENSLKDKHKEISNIVTPKPYVSQKQGFDYVDEGYMRSQLNKHYPVWGWEIIKYEFIGDKAISVHGRLTIIDSGVQRAYDSVAAHRVATNQKGYVDLGNDMKAANTDCFKVAVNRLCNIADDVYRKQVADLELSGEQFQSIKDLLIDCGPDDDLYKRVSQGIKDKSINNKNYDKVIEQLKAKTVKAEETK